MNQRIAKWFDQGKISEAIKGESEYFITDITYRDSHDVLLVLRTLIDWANKKDMQEYATFCFYSVFEARIENDDLLDALDLIYAYLLVLEDAKDSLHLNMGDIETRLRNLINIKSKDISNDERLRNLVFNIYKKIPSIL